MAQDKLLPNLRKHPPYVAAPPSLVCGDHAVDGGLISVEDLSPCSSIRQVMTSVTCAIVARYSAEGWSDSSLVGTDELYPPWSSRSVNHYSGERCSLSAGSSTKKLRVGSASSPIQQGGGLVAPAHPFRNPTNWALLYQLVE